jgi:hypothetical protein
MGRLHRGGVTGGSGVGDISVTATTFTAPLDQDITMDAVGTGIFKIASDAQLQAQGDLRFADADSSNYVAFQAPATVASNLTWTLPATDGSANQVLSTNGSAVLSFASPGPAVTANNSDATTNYIYFGTTVTGTASAVRVATTTRPLAYQPSTGTLSSTLFNETSSITLKENLVPIEGALDKILALQAYMYDRKDGSRSNEPGLIAEEVNEIIPEVVGKNLQGQPESIAYQRLVAYLIESVKKLKQDIDSLKLST